MPSSSCLLVHLAIVRKNISLSIGLGSGRRALQRQQSSCYLTSISRHNYTGSSSQPPTCSVELVQRLARRDLIAVRDPLVQVAKETQRNIRVDHAPEHDGAEIVAEFDTESTFRTIPFLLGSTRRWHAF